jgi:mannan endo-1,4-beta-mannosidase
MKTLALVLIALTVPAIAVAQTATVSLTCPDGPPIVAVDGGAPPEADAGVPPVRDAGRPVRDAGPPPSSHRPPASKGQGFYVVGTDLYDGNGVEFRARGTNKTHQDNWAQGLGHTKSNTTRWLVYFADDPERTIADMQSPNIGGSTTFGQAVAVPGFWDGTCKSDSGSFETMVNRWVRDAKKYQSIERYMILNIANEWGDDPERWRDAYVSAIPRIRQAGWHGAIMVDAPGCGQNARAIIDHGRAVFDADVEKNVVFDFHVYGNWCDSAGGVPPQWGGQHDLEPTIAELHDTGLAVVVGEFGPGRNIGPSPTMITPERVIHVAEEHGLGWLSWSWDDNDLGNAKCSDNSFCHVFDTSTASIEPANLTTFGGTMVDQWHARAHPASVFPTPTNWRWQDYLLVTIPPVLVAMLIGLAVHHFRKARPQRRVMRPFDDGGEP